MNIANVFTTSLNNWQCADESELNTDASDCLSDALYPQLWTNQTRFDSVKSRNQLQKKMGERFLSSIDLALQQIRHSYQNDHEIEIKRLKEAGILEISTLRQLEPELLMSELNIPPSKGIRENQLKELKVMIGRALEIQKLFSKTHYCFFHGMSSQIYPLFKAYKIEAKMLGLEPQKHFKLLRSQNPEIFLKRAETQEKTIEKYTSSPFLYDHTLELQTELLSCSPHPLIRSGGESMLSSLVDNFSVNLNPSFKELKRLGVTPMESKEFKSACGHMVVVCIRKKFVLSKAYLAHPFGTACRIASHRVRSTLDYLQTLTDPNEISCPHGETIQFRVVLNRLKSEDDDRIVVLTALSSETKKKIKQRVVEQVAQQANKNPIRPIFLRSKL